MMKKQLSCGSRSLDLSRPNVMGILNATPDSFSDGGLFADFDSAMRQAESMVMEGADIIDIGGESTRPGAAPVSEQEELSRVIPLVEAVVSGFDTVISVDTSTPSVMREAAKAGAHIINDVRALARPGALEAASVTGLPVCLMHMQGSPATMQASPSYEDVVRDIETFLAERVHACEEAGINREKVLLDPGFGFGKTPEHNYRLLNQLERFTSDGFPVLVGVSRKSMIGHVLNGRPPQERVIGSVAAAVIAAMKGASIIRVHDVGATRDAMAVVAATRQQN